MASDLYGFREGDISAARSQLENMFLFPMDPHESSFVSNGEYYAMTLPGGITLSLRSNFDEREGEWAEEDFQAFPILLYVEAKEQGDEVRRQLARAIQGIQFLQREVCTPDRRFLRIRCQDGRDVVVLEKVLSPR